MSMPQEIVDKFQQYLDDLSGAIVDTVQHVLPDLSPEEQQDAPIIQSESFFAHCMFRAISRNYLQYGNDNGLYYAVDIELRDNDILFGNQTYVGLDRNIWTDAAVEEMNTAVFDNPPESFTTDTGDIYAFIGYNCEFKLYAGGVYDYSKVGFTMGADGSATGKKTSTGFSVYINELTYSIDENSVVYPNKDYSQMNPWGTHGFYSIADYPIIGNVKDLTGVNTFITKMGATNNYTNTYTTPDNKTITVYYGDNYIITHVNDDEPVSYNDVKNALNIAINQINDDNDIDLDVPDYPIPPPPDYTDDNFGLTTTGFSSNIGGAGNYWLMDLATLAGFISDFKTTAPAGSMISQNILSCYVNALNHEWETGKDNIVIHAAGAQNTPYTSTSQYDYIYQYNPHIVVGQYKVPRVTETFYDFNPYSTYELYIPFCGWIGLPDTVAGRNIRVYMDFDVATMSCKAYVMVEMEDGSGATICGEITGSFGAPCPVQVIEGGLYKQAMINSGLQIASGVVSGLMGGAFGGPVGASMLATGGMNAVQGLASAYMAGNTNYGQTIGRAGDTSGLCGGHYCYIKITHPVIDDVVFSDTFGHTTGYPCYIESELSELVGSGFTVCLNPHVHVNCTQSEKDEIKQLLESGVIL